MKATGIVRRIDDLGRIVIPKEIRKQLNIKEGDPLEVYTTKDGEVIFKKYALTEEKDWEKAKDIICALYPKISFALYDSNGQKVAKSGMFELGNTFDINCSNAYAYAISTADDCKDILGYFMIHPQTERDITSKAENELRAMLDILLTDRE